MDSEVITLYKHLHQIPQIGLEEYQTSQFIKEYLAKIPAVEFIKSNSDKFTGVVATLKSSQANKKSPFLFRCDIDALPITEQSGVSYSSSNGFHHACGHDAHTAMMLVAVKEIAAKRQLLERDIIFCFQPGEEGKGGAAKLLSHYPNLLDGIQYCFAIHLGNNKMAGVISVTDGFINANSNRFSIQVEGKSGHVMLPNIGIDAAYIGSQLITHLYSMKNRILPPLAQGTLVVTGMNGGSNITSIMENLKITGSVRTISTEYHRIIMKELEQFPIKFCQNFGAKCKVTVSQSKYRSVKNHEDPVKLVRKELTNLFGEKNIEIGMPGLNGEDFCEFSEKVPSCYFILGSGLPGSIDEKTNQSIYPPHSSKFKIDEGCLDYGVKAWIKLAFSSQQK